MKKTDRNHSKEIKEIEQLINESLWMEHQGLYLEHWARLKGTVNLINEVFGKPEEMESIPIEYPLEKGVMPVYKTPSLLDLLKINRYNSFKRLTNGLDENTHHYQSIHVVDYYHASLLLHDYIHPEDLYCPEIEGMRLGDYINNVRCEKCKHFLDISTCQKCTLFCKNVLYVKIE